METSTTLVEQITSQLGQLAPPKLREVLDFVKFLAWQELHSDDESGQGSLPSEQLMDELGQTLQEGVPPLSDYAVSRAGIYEEHP
jgi:hypothetical protein